MPRLPVTCTRVCWYAMDMRKICVLRDRGDAAGSQHDQGPVCGGICCDAETERQLQAKATKTFERLVKHHIRSQRGLWESAANVYKGKCGCVGRCQQCGWRIKGSVNLTVGCFFVRLTRIKSVRLCPFRCSCYIYQLKKVFFT
uniref:Uncharacterized protein n=1 Tax=Anopheles melas TaxID=34690 RepID=A0A182TYT4_9DIPT